MIGYCQQEQDNISNITESSSTCNVYYLEGSTSILQFYFDYALLKPIPVRLSHERQHDGQLSTEVLEVLMYKAVPHCITELIFSVFKLL